MRPPPKFKIIVLNAGDEQASHMGSTNGLSISAPELNDGLSEELRAALEDALKNVDFDDWFDEGD